MVVKIALMTYLGAKSKTGKVAEITRKWRISAATLTRFNDRCERRPSCAALRLAASCHGGKTNELSAVCAYNGLTTVQRWRPIYNDA